MNLKLLIITLSIFSINSFAQEQITEGLAVAESLKFMSEQNHKGACDILKRSPKKSMTVNILLAQCSTNLNDLESAENHYKLALKDTDSPKIHYELAHILLKQGKTQEAEKEFKLVAGNDVPIEIKKGIEDFLVRKNQQPNYNKKWSLLGTIGFISDSNVNAGPTSDSTMIYGLPFTLSAGSTKVRDTGIKTNIGGGYEIPINDNFSWVTSGSYDRVDYSQYKTFNSQNISLLSGPKFSQDHFQFTTQATYIKDYLNNYDYRTLLGVAWNGLVIINPQVALITVGNQFHQNYQNAPDRNGTLTSFGGGVAYLFDNNGSRLNLMIKRNNIGAQDLANASKENQYTLSLSKNLPYGLTLTSEYSYTQSKYQAMDVMYLVKRSDHRTIFSIGLSKKLNETLTLNLNLTDIDNKSKIDIYNYDRRQINFFINQSF